MDLTIVITVRDRHENLHKIFSYYKDLECRKIVADSSLQKLPSNMKVPNDFEYIYVGPMHWIEKWHIIFNMVDTKYVLDNSDDDLVLLSAIPKCIQHMEESEGCVSCAGVTYCMIRGAYPLITTRCPRKTHANIKLTEENKFSNWGTKQALKDTFVGGLFLPLSHSVMKTEVYQDIIRFFYEHKQIADIKLMDRVFAFLVKLFGENHTLPINYQIRDKRTPTVMHFPHVQQEHNYNTPAVDMVTDSNIYPLAEYLTSITGGDVQDSLDFCKHLLLTNFAQGQDYCEEYSSRLEKSVPFTLIKKNMRPPFDTCDYFDFLSKTEIKELLTTITIVAANE